MSVMETAPARPALRGHAFALGLAEIAISIVWFCLMISAATALKHGEWLWIWEFLIK